MLGKIISVILSLIFSLIGIPFGSIMKTEPSVCHVFLGVENYGNISATDKDGFNYIFFSEGKEQKYKIKNDTHYTIQNRLTEGVFYSLTIENGVITDLMPYSDFICGKAERVNEISFSLNGITFSPYLNTKVYSVEQQAGRAVVKEAVLKEGDNVSIVCYQGEVKEIYITPESIVYTPPISNTAGLKTLKNFIATALQPVGTTLYVYGGGWDWQDKGSSGHAMSIGLSQSWIDFFNRQDSLYQYKNEDDHSKSYYPHGGWNQYYYLGLDCSGYVGWTVYNTLHTQNGIKGQTDGYVGSSTLMAKRFSEYGWGSWRHDTGNSVLGVGDIISMSGHVYISLGTCNDGSVVILHSTVSQHNTANEGSGVQLGAISPDNDKNCEAFKLAEKYMTRFYPLWSERYEIKLCGYESYIKTGKNENTGIFKWDISGNGTISDPDGYSRLTPDEILKDLFGS